MNKIQSASGSSSKLWKSLNALLKRSTNTDVNHSSGLSPDIFLDTFEQKVSGVRSMSGNFSQNKILQPATTRMMTFRAYTMEEVGNIIMCSPTKSCELDPIPTFILKEMIDTLLPFLTAMCNASLQEGHLPVLSVMPLLGHSSNIHLWTPPRLKITVLYLILHLCQRSLNGWYHSRLSIISDLII